jgi:hypothetical protein
MTCGESSSGKERDGHECSQKKKERGERKVEDGAKGVDGGLAGRSFHDHTGKQEGAQLSAANRESPTRFLRT